MFSLQNDRAFRIYRYKFDNPHQRQLRQPRFDVSKSRGQKRHQAVPRTIRNRVGLQQGAGVLAQDYGFREAVATNDEATVRSALDNLRARQKVDGALILGVDGYVTAMTHVAKAFDASFDASTIELRPSKAGNYMGLTLSVYVTSREQLDELYRTLTTHPMVKIVL